MDPISLKIQQEQQKWLRDIIYHPNHFLFPRFQAPSWLIYESIVTTNGSPIVDVVTVISSSGLGNTPKEISFLTK